MTTFVLVGMFVRVGDGGTTGVGVLHERRANLCRTVPVIPAARAMPHGFACHSTKQSPPLS